MNKKIIIYIAGALLAIGIILAVIFKLGLFGGTSSLGQSVSPSDTANSGSLPVVQPIQNFAPAPVTSTNNAPQGSTLSIGTVHGSVTINSPYLMPAVMDQEFLIIKDNSDYQINYDTENSYFAIFLYANGAVDARQKAEADFLQTFGVSRSDACKLTVLESYGASPAAGFNGLSFCAGGEAL